MHYKTRIALILVAIFAHQDLTAQIVEDRGTGSVKNNGVLNGTASITTEARFGAGAMLVPAGDDNRLHVSSTGGDLDMHGSYTFMTWFKLVSPGTRGLIVFGNCCTTKNGYTMNLDETFGVQFWGGSTVDNLNYNQFAVVHGDYQDGDWHHAAIRITEDESAMFFDGVLQSTGDNTNIPTEPSKASVNDISTAVPNIGGRAITSNPEGSTATVIIDEVRVYARALDQTGIIAAMNNTGPLPDRLYFTFDDDTEIEPQVPCEFCDSHFFRPIPASGAWVSIGVPDSGFLLDIQNGILAGFYFGYDQAGNAQWFTFNGLLESDGELQVSELTADLLRFEGGGCITCDPAPANAHSDAGTIRMSFSQKNHGKYSVNNGPERNLTFLSFGTTGSSYFSDETPYFFPDPGGTGNDISPWTVVISRYSTIPQPVLADDWPEKSNLLVHMSKGVETTDTDFGKRITYSSFEQVEGLPVLEIVCGHFSEDDQLNCVADIVVEEAVETFQISIGNLGAFRIYGETTAGDTLEAFRLHYR